MTIMLQPPKGISIEHEQKFFEAANLLAGRPLAPIGARHLDLMAKNALQFNGIRNFVLLGRRTKPFRELALQFNYKESQFVGAYKRYIYWYFKQEEATQNTTCK